MNAFTPAAQAFINASMNTEAPDAFDQEVEGMIQTIEHLAVKAAHANEPCAKILFTTAHLLRTAVLDTLG